jgi:hypothetical protein
VEHADAGPRGARTSWRRPSPYWSARSWSVVVIPLLLFGIELLIVGLLIAAGILSRGLLGRPWVVRGPKPRSDLSAELLQLYEDLIDLGIASSFR